MPKVTLVYVLDSFAAPAYLEAETGGAAARLKAQFPIAYADAFAATLAQELNALLVTGDPEFKAVEPQVGMMWLPRK